MVCAHLAERDDHTYLVAVTGHREHTQDTDTRDTRTQTGARGCQPKPESRADLNKRREAQSSPIKKMNVCEIPALDLR